MSTGIELSMFLTGTVSVMKASLPTRCAWSLSTAAGMRTIGASGGPFLPQAATTKARTTNVNHEGREFLSTTKGTKFTKLKTNFTSCSFFFVSFVTSVVENVFVPFSIRRPPDQSRSARLRGAARAGFHQTDGNAAHRRRD